MSDQLKAQEAALLETLAHLGGKLTADEDVVFQGQKYILPENIDLRDGIKFLHSKLEEDEEEISFSQTYPYRPWDGARAAGIALRNTFGMTRQKATWSFFGKNPPKLMTINTDVDQTEQVPWGKMAVPLLPGADIYFGHERHPELGLLFQITVNAPKKYRFHIQGMFAVVAEELRRNSMYRGKAFDGQENPEFLDLSGVDPTKVIYADEVVTQLEANVWGIIEYAEAMRQNGLPLKRAVLLEGEYGTGKTLAAYLTAKRARAHGWTTIYCRPGKDSIMDVMSTARLYQPAVVFFEDVDVIADAASQDGIDTVTRLLDLFDGLQGKDKDILCILTTNHVERIHKGMIRPGRLDAVIHIGALDRNGTERLVQSLIRPDLLDPDTDFDRVYAAMHGEGHDEYGNEVEVPYLPAFTREVIDRAKRYSVVRGEGMANIISTDDLVNAAVGLRPQWKLMQDATEHQRPDVLSVTFDKLIEDVINRSKLHDVGTPAAVRFELTAKEPTSLEAKPVH